MSSASPSGQQLLQRAGIVITYWYRHRRLPRLRQPALFTELVQHRKLHDRDPRLPALADKVAVKSFVKDLLGPEWLIPTMWDGDSLPATSPWTPPFVVKARHACNRSRFVLDAAAASGAGWASARREAQRWMRSGYGGWLSEWLYGDIPRGLLVEPFIGEGRVPPLDYKFYVFGGRVGYIQVHLGRGVRHRWVLFDRDWRRVSAPTGDAPPPPTALGKMVEAAELLGRGLGFVRVDLYDAAAGPRFGELTFYPGSGLDPFNPVSLDRRMGEDWRNANAAGA